MIMRRRRLWAIPLGAVVMSSSIVGVAAMLSRDTRGALVTSIAERQAIFSPPVLVLVGDSLTVQGAPWGSRISSNPFSAVTKARSGFMAWQMEPLTNWQEWGFKPRAISYMAGTNDAGTNRITDEQSLRDQLANIHSLLASGARVIVTLAPPNKDPVRSARTRRLDAALANRLSGTRVRVIDLWPELAANGVIKPEYTTDGTHFTEAAYNIWAEKLRRNMP